MTTTGIGCQHTEYVMGTAVSIDIRDGGRPGEALGEVVSWLHHVDRTFSPYLDSSQISALGRGDMAPSEASEEVRDVLRRCEGLRRETGGVFDVNSVKAPNGSNLDPSGFVKGWSVEHAAQLLESMGCHNFCINAGGDIAIRGEAAQSVPWRIGIRHPEVSDALSLVVQAEGRTGIATSATYERGAHIVDPRTGSASTELASATVIGEDLGLADAYATTMFVMGLEGLDWIRTVRGYDAYLITHESLTVWSPGFRSYLARAEDDEVENLGDIPDRPDQGIITRP
jgi:thiamine biosynthesis lipoprotein